jgi:hypothetical protein
MKLSVLVANLALGYLIAAGVYQTVQWLAVLPFLAFLSVAAPAIGVLLAGLVFVLFIVLWIGSMISGSAIFED